MVRQLFWYSIENIWCSLKIFVHESQVTAQVTDLIKKILHLKIIINENKITIIIKYRSSLSIKILNMKNIKNCEWFFLTIHCEFYYHLKPHSTAHHTILTGSIISLSFQIHPNTKTFTVSPRIICLAWPT